jgi:hypothetical protein
VKEAEIRAAEQDCARLVTGYCQAADCDDVEAFVALFTTDAQWSRPDGSTVRGHDEMREYFAARPGNVVSAHVCSNILVEVTGQTRRQDALCPLCTETARWMALPPCWLHRSPSWRPGRVRAHRARLADSPPPIPDPLREPVTAMSNYGKVVTALGLSPEKSAEENSTDLRPSPDHCKARQIWAIAGNRPVVGVGDYTATRGTAGRTDRRPSTMSSGAWADTSPSMTMPGPAPVT